MVWSSNCTVSPRAPERLLYIKSSKIFVGFAEKSATSEFFQDAGDVDATIRTAGLKTSSRERPVPRIKRVAIAFRTLNFSAARDLGCKAAVLLEIKNIRSDTTIIASRRYVGEVIRLNAHSVHPKLVEALHNSLRATQLQHGSVNNDPLTIVIEDWGWNEWIIG